MDTPVDLTALTIFALASSATPGPNNLLVMRSGARFGLAPTGPHIIGVEAGLAGLVLLSWLGIGAVLLALPWALSLMRWACFAYLLWLAWQVLRDPGAGDVADGGARPWGVVNGALFQLVNPKAWMMAITGITAFSTGRPGGGALGIVIATFVGIGSLSLICWALWGATLHRVLRRPAARRLFNVAMAAVVAATAISTLRTT